MRYFIVVTKQEILVISLTDFFDAASRRHNDVSGNNFVPAIEVIKIFQQDSAVHQHCAPRTCNS